MKRMLLGASIALLGGAILTGKWQLVVASLLIRFVIQDLETIYKD